MVFLRALRVSFVLFVSKKALESKVNSIGSGQDNHLHLLQKLPNSFFLQGLKRFFWRIDQFKAVLILKKVLHNTIVPPPWREKGKLRTTLLFFDLASIVWRILTSKSYVTLNPRGRSLSPAG
jgi:hypothetical protein